MRVITIDESKQIQLNILKEIRHICEEYGIRYYLAYGTLLGAVRHGGFIPWDDDIDIVMPRADYNRFIKLAKSEIFDLYCIENNSEYIYSFGKASDKKTQIKPDGIRCKVDLGVSVDVFPLDGAGETEEEAAESFGKTAILYGLCIAANWEKYIPGRTDNKKKNLMRYGSFVLSRFVNREKVLKKYSAKVSVKDFDTVTYSAVYSSPYREREIMPRTVYGQPSKVLFEGEEFNAPADSHTYLTKMYGDYMQLPPEDKRVPLHTTNIFFRE